jgi:hypothetical protein
MKSSSSHSGAGAGLGHRRRPAVHAAPAPRGRPKNSGKWQVLLLASLPKGVGWHRLSPLGTPSLINRRLYQAAKSLERNGRLERQMRVDPKSGQWCISVRRTCR